MFVFLKKIAIVWHCDCQQGLNPDSVNFLNSTYVKSFEVALFVHCCLFMTQLFIEQRCLYAAVLIIEKVGAVVHFSLKVLLDI